NYVVSTLIEQIIIDGQVFPVKVSDTTNQSTTYNSISWNNKLYLSLGRDIFGFDGKKVVKAFTGQADIISLSKDQKDNLWIGYRNNGAERYKSDDFKKPWRPSFLEKKSVTKIMEDKERGFWFTTLESGVYYVP